MTIKFATVVCAKKVTIMIKYEKNLAIHEINVKIVERELIYTKECFFLQKRVKKAMAILKAKIFDYYEEQRNSEYDANRKNQVGRGNRNERIRTYNYPQGRVTDHRTNLSSYDLTGVLAGNLDEFIDAMILKERTEMLANLH